jgi:diguanylate cyclase (GGDEF)-like protein/PAS domain S-box-containing protein
VCRTGQPIYQPAAFYQDQRIAGWREHYIYKLPSGEVVTVYDDVTELKKAEEIQTRHQLIFEKARDAILMVRLDGRIIDVNLAAINAYGYSRDEFLTLTVHDLRIPEEIDQVDAQMEQANSRGILFETLHRRRDGSYFPVEVNSTGAMLNHERILVSVIRDITERRQSEESLRQSEEKYRNIFENTAEGIYQTTPEGRFININPAFCEMLGYSRPEEIINNITDIGVQLYVHPEDRKKLDAILAEKNRVTNYEAELYQKNGNTIWIAINARAVRDQSGKILYYEGTCRDITERKQAEAQLKYLSYNDLLTGLYNRNYFEEEMRRIGKMRNVPVGIIMCDVDGLKLVNDTMGHKTGDELLIAASHVLRACFRESDIIARVGGDEFSVLLPYIDDDRLQKAAHRIRVEVQRHNMGNNEVPLSMSIGIAFRQDDSVNIYDLFERADNSMYREKLRSSQSARSAIVQTLMKTMEVRDFVTEKHSGRMQKLMTKLTKELNLTQSKLSDLLLFTQFHDIGKVGIPDRILLKPGPLSEEEKLEMQSHSEIGSRIAQSSADLAPISDLILKHHERWDGKGYPLGLSKEDIPLECRMLAIIDAYDAMTSDRPYRKAMSHQQAVAELIRCRNSQFDPYLVDKFLKVLRYA